MKNGLNIRNRRIAAGVVKALVLGTLFFPITGRAAAPEARPNILFVAIDDLRPELACYGHPQAKTPAIDRLAKQGMVFDRAYCQQALCGPSRLSVLTGMHPHALGVYGMGRKIEWREHLPELVSLPQLFRQNGYYVRGIGKMYDNRLGVDNAGSWSEPHTPSWKPMFADPAKTKSSHAVECMDVPDEIYTDGNAAALAMEFLNNYDREEPFFLALGFAKPHLPFVAPKKYWDLYDRNRIALPAEGSAPVGCTEFTLANYKEIADYGVSLPVNDATARELRHGYLACVSYVDAQLGKVLALLEKKKLAKNTIVVVWGDHGYKLGDHGEWAKHTNLERDAHVPLIIRAGHRGRSRSLVELVDLFPTLCELARLPTPGTCEGKSLVPILRDPEAKVRDFAVTQYPRKGHMGFSIRTDRWRYTEWRWAPAKKVDVSELYDLKNGGFETANVMEANPDVAKQLGHALKEYLNNAEIRQETIVW